jgi:AbrB family looped-hinge helix DNA binding protein
MHELVVTMSTRGRVTLPAAVRERLGVAVGDRVAFVLNDAGDVWLRSVPPTELEALQGAAGTLERPLSWSQKRDIAREDYLRGAWHSQGDEQ